MRATPFALGWALVLSVLLHAGMLELVTGLLPAGRMPRSAALDVRLRPAELPAPRPVALSAPLAPRLLPPKEPSAHASAARAAPAAPRVLVAPPRAATVAARQRDHGVPRPLEGEAARSAYRQMEGALFYPREAIAQGLEGEATVLMFLDETGNAIAARLEASSGHALLDDAAVRAARALRALPAGAPREALLPVRFRLR